MTAPRTLRPKLSPAPRRPGAGLTWAGVRRALMGLGWLWVMLLGTRAGPALAQTSTEAQLKAAYLVNFFKYVEWPQAPAEYRLCLFGRTELWSYLAPYQGRKVAGKPLLIKRVNGTDEALQCHQLYLPAGEMARAAELLGRIAREPVLSVGDSEAFLDAGGAVALTPHGGQLQFNINARALKQAHLKAGTPMLRLAHSIHGQDR